MGKAPAYRFEALADIDVDGAGRKLGRRPVQPERRLIASARRKPEAGANRPWRDRAWCSVARPSVTAPGFGEVEDATALAATGRDDAGHMLSGAL